MWLFGSIQSLEKHQENLDAISHLPDGSRRQGTALTISAWRQSILFMKPKGDRILLIFIFCFKWFSSSVLLLLFFPMDPYNVDPGLITPPYRSTRSTRSTRSSEEVQKPNPPNNVTIHSSINDYYKIPMGKDWKTNDKPSDSYKKR